MKQKLIELKEKQANPQIGDCNTPLLFERSKMISIMENSTLLLTENIQTHNERDHLHL